ncbi:MAG: hypothetical protein H6811_01785 [Phycisphaeraceae bacterium]|nr:hypothetical protein [Phycisphaeraceae bacterium]
MHRAAMALALGAALCGGGCGDSRTEDADEPSPGAIRSAVMGSWRLIEAEAFDGTIRRFDGDEQRICAFRENQRLLYAMASGDLESFEHAGEAWWDVTLGGALVMTPSFDELSVADVRIVSPDRIDVVWREFPGDGRPPYRCLRLVRDDSIAAALSDSEERSREREASAESAINRMRSAIGLGTLIQVYVNDNNDIAPPDLGTVVVDYERPSPERDYAWLADGLDKSSEEFWALDRAGQLAWINEHSKWVYLFGGVRMMQLRDPSNTIMLFEHPHRASDVRALVVLYADGHTQVMPPEDLSASLHEQTGRTLDEWAARATPGKPE